MNIKPWRNDIKRWLELPPLVEDSRVYSTSRHHQVSAMDAENGKVLWTADLSDELLESPALVEDSLLVRGREDERGSLTALDRESGEKLWSKSFSPRWKYTDVTSPEGPVVIRRDSLAGEDSEAMLTGLSPQTGEVLWEVAPQARTWGVPVRDEQGRLFLELRDGRQEQLMAVDGRTGSLLWTHQGEIWGQPQPLGDGLLVARRDGLSVLNSEDGEVRWEFGQPLASQPLVTPESIVLTSSRPDDVPGSRLTGLDPQTGEVKWHYDTPHLTGLAPGPNGRLLHHAYKLDQQGVPQYYVHALDNETGRGLWSLELGSEAVDGVGYDKAGRVAVAVSRGREKELLMVRDGELLWRHPVEGVGLAVAGNGVSTAVMDRQGITVLDAESGDYRGQVTANSPATNYDGVVSRQGRMALSGIDGEMVSLALEGAETILESTSKTPGSFRHYRYDMGESEDGHIYADVKADGQFVRGDDALLVSKPSSSAEQDDIESRLVNGEKLASWDDDGDGYLSRAEMNRAEVSLWWDRDFDGQISRGDGLVAMEGEGNRQAVLDLEREKVEVRVSRFR